jgi:hypothetical protein
MEDIIYFFGGIAFYFVLDLLKVYYKKKIENEATLEDLPALTEVSENVKQEFRKKLSDINAQLSVLSNQSSLVNEKSIQVLNNFFERCLEIKDLHSQNFGDFAGKDLSQTILDYQIEVEKAHRKLYSDYHNLVLFHIKNKNIIQNASDIVASNDLIKMTFKRHFGKIKLSILQEVGNFSSPAYKDAIENSDKVSKEYYDDQKANFELFNKNFNSLLKSLNSYFSEYGLNYDYEGLKK